ncbi:TonB-dependent receptor plug domain-containing protein [Sphingobacterium sp. UT-1RO-CII-1]|uniref:TonB-dependent receptor plug domain-containing protein n=1 Tax=Sphingobacterium sp. UT-1RO-CII-1 TaxID=2995225 RepID=UPI00227D2882|nr:TonB-dependent receptor plug domain-containing protein [Sphingobacterium sp. UT-1RO-CII-1]MCY4779648.1 TonB-dependent receptor plug domain-containing protein [Sphingobacterium sp. UT-1RO-CII-1]
MRKFVLFVMLHICCCNFLFAQNLVSGVVTDSLNRPVSGVKISYKIEDKTVYTDVKGRFEFFVESSKGYLLFEHMGYVKKEMSFAGKLQDLHVVMHALINEIDLVEVVSTGYQVIAKERATGSFEQLGTEILEQRVSSNILDKLEGHVPGLQYDNRKGKAEINIRGINTLSDGLRGPLIVVDNFPYEGEIEDINPNDVESVTFLKDAAASSIWGSRAGNGVIVINLKKPADKLQVGFVSNYTLREKSRIKDMPYLNSSDFIDVEQMLFEEGFYNSAYNSANSRLNIFSPVVDMLFKQQNGLLSQEDVEKKIVDFRKIDFRDELLKYIYQNESLQQHNVSISNGTAYSKYRMSVSYNGGRGQRVGSSTDNLSLNLQHILKPSDKLEVSTRFGLINTEGKSYRNLIDHNYSPGGGKSNLYPYAALRDDMGSNLTIPAHYNTNFVDTVGQGRLLDWHYAPLDDVGHNLAHNSRQQIEAQLNLEYSPLSWLKIAALYNYQTYRNEAEALNKESSFYTRSLINQFTQIDGDNIKYIVPLGGINTRSYGLMNSHKIRGSKEPAPEQIYMWRMRGETFRLQKENSFILFLHFHSKG